MLIEFSRAVNPESAGSRVAASAARHNTPITVKWARQHRVRFTIDAPSGPVHDDVIRDLLQQDPQAKVKTARATYHGLEDFDRQFDASFGDNTP